MHKKTCYTDSFHDYLNTLQKSTKGCPKKNGVQLQISIIQRRLDRLK